MITHLHLPLLHSLKAAILSGAFLMAVGSAADGALIGDYQFQGNLDNSVAGLGVLTVHQSGGTVGFIPEGWSWNNATGDGSGLELQLDAPIANYSIGIIFQFSAVNSYRKLIDYSDLQLDRGLYVSSGSLEYFTSNSSVEIVSGPAILPNQWVTLLFTRDSSGLTTVYLNNAATPALTFTNSTSSFQMTNSLNFFQNDADPSAFRGEFSPSGAVSHIKVWDHVLSSSDVPSAFAPIPEPNSLIFVAAGMAALIARRRRQG